MIETGRPNDNLVPFPPTHHKYCSTAQQIVIHGQIRPYLFFFFFFFSPQVFKTSEKNITGASASTEMFCGAS